MRPRIPGAKAVPIPPEPTCYPGPVPSVDSDRPPFKQNLSPSPQYQQPGAQKPALEAPQIVEFDGRFWVWQGRTRTEELFVQLAEESLWVRSAEVVLRGRAEGPLLVPRQWAVLTKLRSDGWYCETAVEDLESDYGRQLRALGESGLVSIDGSRIDPTGSGLRVVRPDLMPGHWRNHVNWNDDRAWIKGSLPGSRVEIVLNRPEPMIPFWLATVAGVEGFGVDPAMAVYVALDLLGCELRHLGSRAVKENNEL